MKRSHTGFDKKQFPGAVRITKADGVRVWKYKGKEYASLRAIAENLGDGKVANYEENKKAIS